MTQASPLIWHSLGPTAHWKWLMATSGSTTYSIRRGARRGQFVLRINSQVWSIGFETDLQAEAERIHQTGASAPEAQRRYYDSVICRNYAQDADTNPHSGDPDRDPAAARQHARQTRRIPQED